MPKKKPKPHPNDSIKLMLTIGAKRTSHKKLMQKHLTLVLRRRRSKYALGTHASAGFQRTKMDTDGDRHESEHVVGYNVYAESFDRSKGEGARHESGGLAYLEVKELHRAHPGTGSGTAADTYRDEQRAILEQGRIAAQTPTGTQPKTVSSAIQFNQLEYAMQDDEIAGEDVRIATISYEAMVRNGPSVTYLSNGTSTSFQISQVERAEMLLAYEVRKTKAWPSQERIAQVLRSCGLEPLMVKDAKTGMDVVT